MTVTRLDTNRKELTSTEEYVKWVEENYPLIKDEEPASKFIPPDAEEGKSFKSLGELIDRVILSDFGYSHSKTTFISNLESARDKRGRSEHTGAKKSFEKALLSMETSSGLDNLLIAAEHLEAGENYYKKMSMPRPNKKFRMMKWYYRKDSTSLSHLEAAADVIPDNSLPYVFLGTLKYEEDKEKAVEFYGKAVNIHRKNSKERNSEILDLIAESHYSMFSLEDTHETLKMLVGKFPSRTFKSFSDTNPISEAILNLGFKHIESKDYGKAIEIFEKTKDLEDVDEAATMGIAHSLIIMDNFEEAETILEAAKEKYQGCITLHNLLGILESKKENYEEAIEHFLVAKRLEFKHITYKNIRYNNPFTYEKVIPNNFYWNAVALENTDREEEAISLLQRSFKNYPSRTRQNPQMINLLGRLYFKSGTNETAQDLFDRSASIYIGEEFGDTELKPGKEYIGQKIPIVTTRQSRDIGMGVALAASVLVLGIAGTAVTYKADIIDAFNNYANRLDNEIAVLVGDECYPVVNEARAELSEAVTIAEDTNHQLDLFEQAARSGEYEKAKAILWPLGTIVTYIEKVNDRYKKIDELLTAPRVDDIENLEEEIKVATCLAINGVVKDYMHKIDTIYFPTLQRMQSVSDQYEFVWTSNLKNPSQLNSPF